MNSRSAPAILVLHLVIIAMFAGCTSLAKTPGAVTPVHEAAPASTLHSGPA